METEDLTPAMQEMMAQLAQVRAELNELKGRAGALPQPGPIQPAKTPTITSTRRNTLKRLGLALLGGVATATALGEATAVQAKVVANPQGSLANKAGMLVLPPGTAIPTGTAPAYHYGLIATGDNPTTFDYSSLPTGNMGVYGFSNTYGVYGASDNYGVYGDSPYTGVYGNGNSVGVHGEGNIGIDGVGTNSGTGVRGNGDLAGVVGYSPATGVYGDGTNNGGYFTGNSTGAIGNGNKNFSVTDTTQSGTHIGLVGNSGSNLSLGAINAGYLIGVYGHAPVAAFSYAGFFQGNVNVTGTLTKGSNAFKIDHPLDPENKYLYHSVVESPDMKNIYDGVITLNDQGEAVVEMPDWFEALNSDFRYQLTSIGQASPNLHVAEKLASRKFKIAGGLGSQEVSWMVTGIRQDAYAKAYRIPVEEDKTGDEKGKYLHPEVFE